MHDLSRRLERYGKNLSPLGNVNNPLSSESHMKLRAIPKRIDSSDGLGDVVSSTLPSVDNNLFHFAPVIERFPMPAFNANEKYCGPIET